jgi:predicted peroxiredoxin
VPHKIAIVIYTNITSEAKSAAYRAFNFAEELLLQGDDVTIVFDGGGTATLAEVLKPDNDLHRAWSKAAPALRGACSYCAKAYDVYEPLVAAGIPMLTDFKGHASLRRLLDDGRQIVTF